MRRILTALVAACLAACATAQTAQEAITRLARGRQATVGAAWISGGREHAVNNRGDYPLMSVFKTHCAIAALRRMQREGIPADTLIRVKAAEMTPGTYSPLAKMHEGEDFTMRFDSLLYYSIALSDNNACDVTIRMAGGIEGVNAEMEAIGLAGCALTETEATMAADPQRSYNNRSTPLSVAVLFRKLYEEGILGGDYDRLMKAALEATQTGPDKMKAALAPGMTLAHKTGTGFTLPDGTMTADNDAGAVTLPDGRRIYIAVLVKDTRLGTKENARLIREITEAIIRQEANNNPKNR